MNHSVADIPISILPNGNYTASSLAAALTLTLQTRFPEINSPCDYNNNVGTIEITNFSNSQFRALADETVVSLQNANWYGDGGEHHVYSLNINHLRSMNEVFRNSVQAPSETSYESGFIDLLNVHYIYIYIYFHFPSLGNYNSTGVRGEHTIIKKVPVSSSFGYLIIDSVVALHDKIDVSRQLIKTMQFSFRNVHGDIVDLHGARVSLSPVFQTYG